MRRIGLFVFAAWLAACSRDVPSPAVETADASVAAPPEAAWLLSGSTDERFVRVAKHLRGFDVAMVETGYRYTELSWAGKDHNWDYASYQLAKIETAIGNGTERRPLRAPSARMLDAPIAQVKAAISKRDAASFDVAFTALTATCNACHQAERVPFVRIAPPSVRYSPVTAPFSGDGGGAP